MWQCPKCGREFQKTNQAHFCGEPPKTIDAYISAQPGSVQQLLNQVRDTLRAALPDAEERISWGMPTFLEEAQHHTFCSLQKAHWAVPRP